MDIHSRYKEIGIIKKEVTIGLVHGPPSPSTKTTQPPNTPKKDKRFQSPVFRRAVRTVLVHLDYKPTYSNFLLHDKQHGSDFPLDWYAMARNIGISSPTSEPTSGIYFITKAGKSIEVGKCLRSVNDLIEYNRRLKNAR